MPYLKSRDYVIFKVRYYASEYILNKYGPSHKQHWDRAKLSIEFFWKLFEFVTKKDSGKFMIEHMFFPQESACEELVCNHDIVRRTCEGAYYYLIPKNDVLTIEWIKNNINTLLPVKILKRTRLSYVIILNEKNTYWRDLSKTATEEFLQEQFIKENTRNIIIEKTIK